MAFQTVPVEESTLHSIDDVLNWVTRCQSQLIRIPVTGVLEHGAHFQDDSYLGDGETLLHFNRAGFGALCQRLNFNPDIAERLASPDLASLVLNDLLRQRETRNQLEPYEFVINQSDNAIVGMVSKSYVTYSNQHLLDDISSRLFDLKKSDTFTFHEAYGINTDLTIRFVSVQEHGSIKGRGGEGEDITKFGLEFKNSMVGNSAVHINYYLYRLMCANGMMVPAAGSVNRVFHSGKTDSFHDRLNRSYEEVLRRISTNQLMLEALGDLPFKPSQLAAHASVVNQIFDVIPGSKQRLCDYLKSYLRYPNDADAKERERMRRKHDAHLIGAIPHLFGGEHSGKVFKSSFRDEPTLFDLINVFTEEAKKFKISRKLETEEKAGALAHYLAGHAKLL